MDSARWWQVCSAVLRGARRALDEPAEEAPSPEALEITQFVLRELHALGGGPAAVWAPPTPDGAPVCTLADLRRSLGDEPGPPR